MSTPAEFRRITDSNCSSVPMMHDTELCPDCIAGSGKLTSKKGVLNFVTALLQANVLFAMSVIVTNVERTRLWISAGEVSRATTSLATHYLYRDRCQHSSSSFPPLRRSTSVW